MVVYPKQTVPFPSFSFTSFLEEVELLGGKRSELFEVYIRVEEH